MTVIAIPKILNDRLTDEGAKAFVEIIERVEDSTQKITLQMAEDRFEKRLAQVQSAIETKIAESSAGLKAEIAVTNTKIAESKSEMIRWMFIFWIGQFASIVGVLTAILFAFFKH